MPALPSSMNWRAFADPSARSAGTLPSGNVLAAGGAYYNTPQPRQTPLGAAGATAGRAYIPGGAFFIDQPQAGYGDPGPAGLGWRLGSALPWVGGLIRSLGAGMTASDVQNLGPFYPKAPETPLNRGLAGIGSALQYAPSGGILGILKQVLSGVQGLRGASEFFNTTFGQTGVGLGGTALRALVDRMRGGSAGGPPLNPNTIPPQVPSSTLSSPTAFSGASGGSSVGDRFNSYIQPGSNPFANPDTGEVPAWAGGPSTWNRPSWMWGALPSSVPQELTAEDRSGGF